MNGHKWPVEFIGRHDEIALLETQMRAWGTRCFIFIDGPGGIGKTRLLDELEKRAVAPVSKLSIQIPPIIDFDDDRYKFSQNIGVFLGRQIDPQAFGAYFEKLRDLRIAEERAGEAGSPLLGRKYSAVNDEFSKAFNSVSQSKRVVLRFDTTEAVGDSAMLGYVLSIAVDLKNVVIILAGRNGKTLYEQNKPLLGNDALLVPLFPFSFADFQDYLKEKKRILGDDLEDEWLERLFLIAGGVPVLVDMAIEWAQTNRRSKWLDNLSKDDIEELRKRAITGLDEIAQDQYRSIQLRLQEEIVMPIAELQSEFDYLQFLLAKVYPLDLDGVAAMLNLDQERAQTLMEQAYQSVAIKRLSGGWIKLHDEIQDLVREYVWPRRDPDSQWEQRDSRRAIKYLAERSEAVFQRISKLREQEEVARNAVDPTENMAVYFEQEEREAEFWTLRLERLRRQVALDVLVGFEVFEIDFNLARKKVASSSARIGLLDTMAPYVQLEKPKCDISGCSLPIERRLFVMKLKAKQLVYSGTYEVANTVYDELLKYFTENSPDRVELLNGKANALLRLGRFREALEMNLRALRLSDNYPSRQIKIAIDTGWFNRRMGNLDQAAEYYEQALGLAFEQNDDENMALAYQNQAYVYALQDKERQAMEEVRLAIRLWRKLLDDQESLYFRLGQAYNIAGEICLEFERTVEALAFFELSWNIFTREEVDQTEWRANSSSGRGFAHWQLAILALKNSDEREAQLELEDAAKALVWAVDYVGLIDQPGTLNRLAEVYFLQKKWEAAYKNWTESMRIARKIGDAFNELHSLSDLARLAFYHSMNDWATWSDFKRQYLDRRKHYEAYFPVLDGLFFTYLGHLALKDQMVDDAVGLYSRGLPVLSQQGTYAPFNLVGQIEFIEKEILPRLPADKLHDLSRQLLSVWIEGNHDKTALGYFREWAVRAGGPMISSRGDL